MKRIIVITCLLAPMLVWGKQDEYSVYLKNGMLLNKGAVKTVDGSQNFTKFKNTFQQGVGFSYSHNQPNGLILFAGAEAGYEKYKADLAVATPIYGTTVGAPAIPFSIDKTIYYANLNVGVGYKFIKLGKLQPEVRVAQVLHMGMNQLDVNSDNYEVTGYGNNNLVFLKKGNFGSSGSIPSAELLNNLYLGIDILHAKKIVNTVKVGILLQKRFITPNKNANYLDVKYYDANGSYVSNDVFTGKHSSASLIVSVAF